METHADRAINWLELTGRSLASRFPATSSCASYVAERLTALFLERLPAELCIGLVGMLPDDVARRAGSFRACESVDGDASIGYATFVERAQHALAVAGFPMDEDSARAVVDAFLWAVAQELPAELKIRLSENLPIELRSRMNLTTAILESKVA